jgi:hypothetical protein
LAEAQVRIQTAEVREGFHQWASRLGIHGSFSATVG